MFCSYYFDSCLTLSDIYLLHNKAMCIKHKETERDPVVFFLLILVHDSDETDFHNTMHLIWALYLWRFESKKV